MAPSRRLLAQLKAQLGHSPNARWKTVLAPYVDTNAATPAQLRSTARDLSLMTPAELAQTKRARQRELRAERSERRRKEKREPVTFKLVYRYWLLSKGKGNAERWSQRTLEVTEDEDRPLKAPRKVATAALTEERFWRNLRLSYAFAEHHVRLDLPKSEVVFSESSLRALAAAPEDQLMRSASVLMPDWLKHADHIDQMALQQADEKYGCVPTQLAEALLNNRRPVTSLPDGQEVNRDSVKAALDRIKGDNPFADAGYSTRHVGVLLQDIGLTYYAYDANSKCFKHKVGRLAAHRHHSPLAWYVTQGHMYLLTKEANYTVSAEQRGGGRPPKKETPKEKRPVKFVSVEEARAAFEAVEGTPTIYIVDVGNLDELFLQYVAATKILPRVKLDGSLKMEFSVMVRSKSKGEMKAELQAVRQADSRGYKRTFGDHKTALPKGEMAARLEAVGTSAEKVARNGTRPKITFVANPHFGELEPSSLALAADAIGEVYVGQAVGNLVMTVLNAPFDKRNLIERQVKAIFERQKGICNAPTCGCALVKFDKDHIWPNGMGGNSAQHNFQLLCVVCHEEKSSQEKTEGYTVQQKWMSSFHPDMYALMRSQQSKAWAFVERVAEETTVEELPPPPLETRIATAVMTEKNAVSAWWQAAREVPKAVDDDLTGAPIEKLARKRKAAEAALHSLRHAPLPNATKPLQIHSIDLTKCRRHCLYYSRDEWPVYCVADYVESYDGKPISTGRYYVVTENLFPFRGSGWYPHNLVQFGLTRGLITTDQITQQFLPSITLPAEFFRPLVDRLLKAFDHDPQLQKLAVNALVGMMARCAHKASWGKFSLDRTEAGNWCDDEALRFI
jgi:hypothetical protein